MLSCLERYEKIDIIRGFAIAIFAITSSLAIISSPTLVTEQVRSLVPIPNYLAAIVLLFSFIAKPFYRFYTPLLVCIFVWSFYHVFYIYGNSKTDFSPLLFIFSVLFCGVREKTWLFSFNCFRYYLCLSSIIGIVVYISFLFSFSIPYQIQDYYDHAGWYYVNYLFSYLGIDNGALKLCGLFNEPGFFGTILAMYLIADGVNLKKKENIIMLTAGCLTFSLAFFLLLGIFFFFYICKHPKALIFLGALFLILLFVIPTLYNSNDMIAYMLDRFIIEDGQMAGNSRVSDVRVRYLNKMFADGNFLFGYGTGYIESLGLGYDSYQNLILQYGYLGFIINFGLLFYAAIKKNIKRHYLIYVFIICHFSNLYHRPNLFDSCYLLLLFGGCIYINHSYENKSTIEYKNIYKA